MSGAAVAAAAAEQAAQYQAAAAAHAAAAGHLSPLPHAELGAVRLRRRVTYTIGKLAREWSVIVDGGYVDFLGLGEAIAFYVHPGAHTLLIQPPKGAVAAQITFAAAAGDVLGFGCWLPGGVAWRPQVIVQQEPPVRVVGRPPG